MMRFIKNLLKHWFTSEKDIDNEHDKQCSPYIESCSSCGLEIKLFFRKDNIFISPDRDGYNGGMWKKFNGSGKRIGTWNKDLTEMIGK